MDINEDDNGNTYITMTDDEWDWFIELLDKPPEENKKLKELFERPSIFDMEVDDD